MSADTFEYSKFVPWQMGHSSGAMPSSSLSIWKSVRMECPFCLTSEGMSGRYFL